MKPDFKIALIGNPNSGKTTLFNSLTGLRQKIGNYPGVTIDRKSGLWKINKEHFAEVIDLPGTYSIYPKQPDERITIETILNTGADTIPDMVIVVCDATSLQRNLLLCTQIIDTGIPVVAALTMTDVTAKDNISIDINKLTKELGVPIVEVSHTTQKKIQQLAESVIQQWANKKNNIVFYQPQHEVLTTLKNKFHLNNEYEALLLASISTQLHTVEASQIELVHTLIQEKSFSVTKFQAEEVLARYKKIQSIINETVQKKDATPYSRQWTKRIDRYLLHPFWGYVAFVLIFFLVFQALFNWATYPMEAINYLFAKTSEKLLHILPDTILTRLLAEGVLPGIGGVITFVPQITLLFGFISLLEETGYMSRVSLLTDRVFHKTGMNGKSSVALIGGLACAVPAIMGTRTIENYKERLITILVTPLMSCSARLPVYVLLISLVVPDKEILGFINLQGLIMLGLYLLGFVMALLVALIIKLFIKTKAVGTYIAELPIYRKPRWSNIAMVMIEKVKMFVWEAGKIIVMISIVLWFLASFGPGDAMQKAEIKARENAVTTDTVLINNQVQAARLNSSYAGMLGKWIEPAIAPLGFDWKIGIAIITSFAAREVFVGTMATIYSIGSNDNPDFDDLRNKMRQDINPRTGTALYTPASSLALIMFYVFAMQCMSTLAVVHRETKTWKWPLFQFAYMTAIAWIAAFITYHILS